MLAIGHADEFLGKSVFDVQFTSSSMVDMNSQGREISGNAGSCLDVSLASSVPLLPEIG